MSLRKIVLLASLSISVAWPNTKKAETKNELCESALGACKNAVEDLQAENKKLYELYGLQKGTIEIQDKEIDRLRLKNDAWYRREPWLVFVLGLAIGGVTYGVLTK